MNNDGQRIDLVAVEQDIDLHHVRGTKLFELIVHRRIAARHRFELVKEVQHNLTQRHFVGQHDLLAVVSHVQLHAALLVGQRHDRADIVLRHIQMHSNDRLANLGYSTAIGNFRWIFNFDELPIDLEHFIHHARRGGNQVLVKLALQPLLHDFHVQQAQEAAAKAKPQRLADFRLVMQRRIIELELFQRIAQRLVFAGF